LVIFAIAYVGDIKKIDAFLTGISDSGRRRQSKASIATVTFFSTSDDNVSSVGPKAESDDPRRRLSDRRQRQRRESSTSSSSTTTTTSTGPRNSPRSAKRRRSVTSASAEETTTTATTTGPRNSPRPDRIARRRRGAPRAVAKEEESTKGQKDAQQQPFDRKILTADQISNLDAPRFDLRPTMFQKIADSFRCVTSGLQCYNNDEIRHQSRVISFEYRSLDDLFLGDNSHNDGNNDDDNCDESKKFSLSKKFNSDETFRNDLRLAIRLDIFETTPFYAKLSEKASSVLLLPDSSLEGSWRIPNTKNSTTAAKTPSTSPSTTDNPTSRSPRMKHTTRVLEKAFQEHDEEYGVNSINSYFDGDDLFRAIGDICGPAASTHWIDIYGVQDRKINHSWHLDAGQSPNNCRTVLWGFPPENNYHGNGVFSHIIPLDYAFDDIINMNDVESTHHRMEPVLYDGTVDNKYIVRPPYESGKELLIYRDVDVLHSAPDVAYRTSVMRFM